MANKLRNNTFLTTTIVAACLVLGLPGCASRSKVVSTDEQKSTELKARLADLPVPLAAELVEIQSDENQGPRTVERQKKITERFFLFETTLTVDELALFYDEEMEAMGWKKSLEFSQLVGQLVLLFEKPHKRLLIIADPLRSTQRVRLFYKIET